MIKKFFVALITLIIAAVSVCLAAALLLTLLFGTGVQTTRTQKVPVNMAIGDRFQMFTTNQISAALEGVLDVKKVYWLSDDDLIAPEPDQSKFGSAKDPGTLQWLLEDAQPLLDGQTTLFTTETPLVPGTEVTYYLDETIFVVTWKQPFNDSVYTISEVKIADPSQFRRFLAGGSYGSGIQLKTSEMAQSVNAVVASGGDFYAFRKMGVIVYDGVVQRTNAQRVDTCYIDDKGDLLFSYRGELTDLEEAQKFVDDNNIRFSVAFGPVMIDNGQMISAGSYPLGQLKDNYARAALCQMGDLHYLMVTAGLEGYYQETPNLRSFQKVLHSFGCEKAYNLDGGQTAVIVMNDKVINRVVSYAERNVSDILYFATAIPSH